jgi:hypothetical protein
MSTTSTLRRRVVTSLVGVLAGIFVVLQVSPASADVNLSGVNFSSSVQCGGSMMKWSTHSSQNQPGGSFAMIFVWSPSGQKWVTDNVWQDASAWSSWHVANLTFPRGYFNTVYIQYAQSTTRGWTYSGEYIKQFIQNFSTPSTTCLMGT